MKRYIIAVLALFFVLAIGIVLIAGGSSDDTPTQQTQQETPKQLYDYASSPTAQVVYTMRGEIVGDDQFNSIRITISRDKRKLEVLNGYTDRVVSAKTYANNEAAFDTFLRSLNVAGFTKTQETDIADERGVCPTGVRYIYEFQEAGAPAQRTWSVSCTARVGNFGGNAATVRRLFQDQITDYRDLVRGVRLT